MGGGHAVKSVLGAILSGCALIFASFALLAEAGAVLGAGHSHETRMTALSQERPRIGLSTDSTWRVLDLCRNTLAHPDFEAAPEERRARVLAHCQAQVAHAARRAPTDGYVPLMQAVLDRQNGAVIEMLANVDRSRALAPQELWLASLRNAMIEPFESFLTAEEFLGQNADFAVMAQSRSGVRVLASRYLAQPAFRERITSIVETLSPDEQRRFLRDIRFLERQRRDAAAGRFQ